MSTQKHFVSRLKSLPVAVYVMAAPIVVSMLIFMIMQINYYVFRAPAVFDELTAGASSFQTAAYNINSWLWGAWIVDTYVVTPIAFTAGLVYTALRNMRKKPQKVAE